MNEDTIMNEQESLGIISRMIHEAKGYYFESGLSGLVYGFAVFSCSIVAYLRDKGMIAFPFHPFYLMLPVFFFMAIIYRKEEKKKKAKTYIDEAIDYVWMGFMLSAFTAFAAGFAGLYYLPVAIILVLMAMATFLTGKIAKFNYHVIIAFAAWISAIISFFILNPDIYLLLALNAILVWVIPGFMLRTVFKKMHASQVFQSPVEGRTET